ncbi:MAG: hypothetical protein LBT88_08285 [Oscillospiraceae bacterium]|jgi:hypothetical protein|nr:hypothetical protein [Oscillospiraceae bacterium]
MYCENISNNCACGAACSNAGYCQAGGASAPSCGCGNGYGSEYARGYSAGYNTGYDAGYNSGLNVGNSGGGFPPIVPPVATVPPVTLPAIRTNDVRISDGKNVATILGVSFTLTDFMVSDGQPHSLAVGQTYSGTDTLTFPIGRHAQARPVGGFTTQWAMATDWAHFYTQFSETIGVSAISRFWVT